MTVVTATAMTATAMTATAVRQRTILPTVSWPLTDEERLLQSTARDFAQREIAPGAIERDEAERYDRSLFTAMGDLGLTAAPFPDGRAAAPASRTSAGRS